MESNYDFLGVGSKKKLNQERVLLSSITNRYNDLDESKEVSLLITKNYLILELGDQILRNIFLDDVEALTISSVSKEFLIHLYDS